jgi:gliding motility-associated-like protein
MRFIVLVICFFSFTVNAQPPCSNGLGGSPQSSNSVCTQTVFNQPSLPSCTGVTLPAVTQSGCADNIVTDNAVWYRIRIYQSGTLGFTITPGAGGDDYDWQLMNITNRNPQDVYTTNLAVSFNLSATTGPTGCSAAGTLDFVCAGPNPRFNRLVNVTVGQEYLLMVNNYSNSGTGYGLTFSGGTSVLTNPLLPAVSSVSTVGCNTSQIRVTMNQDVLCSSFSLAPNIGSEFSIAGATITGVTSQCSAGTNAVSSFILNLQNPLPAGPHQLNIANGADGNTLTDVCNRPVSPISFPFTVNAQATPIINAVTFQGCAPTILKVALNKQVRCNTISPNGSEFSISPSNPTITSVQTNCSGTITNTDTINIILANPLPQGTYTLTVNNGSDGSTFTDSCGNSTPLGYVSPSFTVPITPAAPVVTTPLQYCQFFVAPALTATGNNLLWYSAASGGTGSTTSPTPNTSAVGTIPYYVSQSTGACEGPRAVINVNTIASPSAPTATSPINYCQNVTNAVPLTATGTSLLWYTQVTGGTSSTIAPTPSTITPGNYIFYVTQTVNGCESQRTPITVNIVATPAAPTVTTPVNLCTGNTATPLTAVGTNLLWYSLPAGGTGSTTAPTPVTTNANTLIAYVSQTINGCEGPRATISAIVSTTPNQPTGTTAYQYCQSNTPSILNQLIGTNILWFNDPTGGTGTNLPPTVSIASVGTQIFYASQTVNNCTSVRIPINIVVDTTPPTPSITTPYNFCVGATGASITATGVGLSWYTTATGGTAITTPPVINTTVASNNTYYVSQKIGLCEGPRAAIVVNVNAIPPPPTVTSNTINYCQNQIAGALTANGTNLLWYTQAANGTSSTTAPIPQTLNTGSIIYYVSQSAAGGCESNRTAITVNVSATPAAPTATTNINYCINATAIPLTAAGNNLLWYTTATGGTGSATAPTPNTTVAGTVLYYVTQTLGTCESARAAITVNTIAFPAAPTVVSPLNLCPNSPTAPLTAIGTNLLWYNAATGGVGSTTAPTPNTTSLSNTNYYVSQSTGNCEGPRALINVVVANFLQLNIGNDTTLCEGESKQLIPIITPAANTYTWSTLGGITLNTINDVNIKDASFNPTDTAEYVLTAILGSCIKTDTVKINVIWKPIVDAGLNTAICLFDSTLLEAEITRFSSAVTDFAWSPTDSLRNPNSLQTFAYPTKTTFYKFTANTTIANYGCAFTVSDSVLVTLQPLVKAFAGNDTIAVKDAPLQLNASGGLVYEWTTSNGNVSLSNSFIKNPKATFINDAALYLKVSDAVGCVGYDSIFVKVYNGPTYYVPNAFTPNGDGVNDIFRAIPVGMANTVYFRIFNRFGELLFETNQFLKGWDGTFKGKPQPNGVYVWVVAGTDRNFKKVEIKGTVNLIR